MMMRHESPFLDRESLEFLRSGEDEETVDRPPEFLEDVQHAEAERMTEQETRKAARYRMVRQPKKVEAFEAPEDEAVAEQLEASDDLEIEPETAAWSGTSEESESEEAESEETESEEAESGETESEGDTESSEGEQDWELDIAEGELLEEAPRARPAPMPVPRNNPIPFAPMPAGTGYWPVPTPSPQKREVNYRQVSGGYIGQHPGRRFLARRSNGTRAHVGVDLSTRFNDPVKACETGTIIAFYPFCCGLTKTSWALLVEHPGAVVNYGELAPDSLARAGLKKGSKVQAGQVIGRVGRNPKGRSVLHFETWAKGTGSSKQWPVGQQRPAGLLNPTKYLLALQAGDLRGSTSQSESESDLSDLSNESNDIVAFYAADESQE